MRRFKKLANCVAAMFALCFVFTVSMVAEAAAYKPGQVYIDPDVNSKNEYYSVLKKRMKTYDSDTIRVVYPENGNLTVSTNKKALQAEIIEQGFESPYGEQPKVYVSGPNVEGVTVEETKYYLSKNGDAWELTQDAGGWYYEGWRTDYNKVYLTPNRTKRYADSAYRVEVETEFGKYDDYYDLHDDGDGKGWYYQDWSQGYVIENGQVVLTPDGQPDYGYSTAVIHLASTKAGTYTVSVSAAGVTQKLKVYVTANGGGIVSATLDKKSIEKSSRKASDATVTTTDSWNYKVSSKAKSGKLKVKGDKGIKITGLVVASIDKNGKAVYKKVKNGGKISLSQALAADYKDYTGYYRKDAKKRTNVLISYKDTYTGFSVTYAVTSKHGYKQIKVTTKHAGDGKSYVSYLDYGYGTLNLWAY